MTFKTNHNAIGVSEISKSCRFSGVQYVNELLPDLSHKCLTYKNHPHLNISGHK